MPAGSWISGLDPNILSTPCEIGTNWHVLTGAACTGKTTLIDMLAERGFQTVAETARVYIDQELAKGRTLDELFADPATETGIEAMQRIAEGELSATDVAFLDRAMPDSLTFRRFKGEDPNEILAECCRRRYASVFILDRLPLELDGARIDDDVMSDYLDEWLARDYEALGYDVVRVPVLPREERLAFILDRLSEEGLL
jgi:predicted ATPase